MLTSTGDVYGNQGFRRLSDQIRTKFAQFAPCDYPCADFRVAAGNSEIRQVYEMEGGRIRAQGLFRSEEEEVETVCAEIRHEVSLLIKFRSLLVFRVLYPLMPSAVRFREDPGRRLTAENDAEPVSPSEAWRRGRP